MDLLDNKNLLSCIWFYKLSLIFSYNINYKRNNFYMQKNNTNFMNFYLFWVKF